MPISVVRDLLAYQGFTTGAWHRSVGIPRVLPRRTPLGHGCGNLFGSRHVRHCIRAPSHVPPFPKLSCQVPVNESPEKTSSPPPISVPSSLNKLNAKRFPINRPSR